MDPTDDPKAINTRAYDRIAPWYLQWATDTPSPRERYIARLLDLLPPNPHVLELACGAGLPATRLLLDRGASVVGNDISPVQLAMARERCPEATFVSGDMTALTFEDAAFDGAACFYAVFHLPREEQAPFLAKMHRWLRPGGVFVFNLATVDEAEIHGSMSGAGMFWSSYGVEHNEAMVTAAGFELVDSQVLAAGDGKLSEDDPDYGVKFQWIVARKPPS